MSSSFFLLFFSSYNITVLCFAGLLQLVRHQEEGRIGACCQVQPLNFSLCCCCWHHYTAWKDPLCACWILGLWVSTVFLVLPAPPQSNYCVTSACTEIMVFCCLQLFFELVADFVSGLPFPMEQTGTCKKHSSTSFLCLIKPLQNTLIDNICTGFGCIGNAAVASIFGQASDLHAASNHWL